MRKIVVFLAGCMLLSACGGGKTELSEADMSAFGTYVDSLDNNLQGKWFTRMGMTEDADSLLAFLRRELPRDGLDTTAFFVPQIAEDMAVVNKLAFDSIGQSINEVLKRLDDHLTKAYVDYTTGQRYGFMRPDKVLNRLDYKVGGPGYAQLFDYEIKAPDFEEAEQKVTGSDRMAYLAASQPQTYVYRALKDQLAKTADKAERAKIAINMERCRWHIVKIGLKYQPDFDYVKDLKDRFRSRIRVAPRVETLPVKDIAAINYPAKSRKPIKFIDNRSKRV